MTKMNPEVKTQIVAALRSGEYKQGTSRLLKDGCHCVWGVICEAYATAHPDEEVKQPIEDGMTAFFGCAAMPPTPTQRWAGITDSHMLTVAGRADTLMALNDQGHATFAQFADAIEAQF